MINDIKRSSPVLPVHILRRMSEADRKSLGDAGVLPEDIQEIAEARSEKELHFQIIGMLARRGVTAFRARMDKKSSIAVGHPDLWFSLKGRACALEVKMPGKNPSPEQEREIARMQSEGWRVAVVRSYREAFDMVNAWEKEIA